MKNFAPAQDVLKSPKEFPKSKLMKIKSMKEILTDT